MWIAGYLKLDEIEIFRPFPVLSIVSKNYLGYTEDKANNQNSHSNIAVADESYEIKQSQKRSKEGFLKEDRIWAHKLFLSRNLARKSVYANRLVNTSQP